MNDHTNYIRHLILVSGPTNSGKSRFAEKLAYKSYNIIYIATLPQNINDSEWSERLLKHKLRRPPDWKLIEDPDSLADELCLYTHN